MVLFFLPEIDNASHHFEEVIDYIRNIDDCIIKPSRDSSSGNRVEAISIKDGLVEGKDSLSVETLLKSYGSNFVIERKIKEARNLSCMNPTSCNSLRIHTAWVEGEPKYLTSYLRVGRAGNVVDNAHKGGICVAIDDDGHLKDGACTQSPYTLHPVSDSGVEFSGYVIQGFSKMIETVLAAHTIMPQFGIMGWDVCMDVEDKVVIIEFNPNPDMRTEQYFLHTTCLGPHQEWILKKVYNRL